MRSIIIIFIMFGVFYSALNPAFGKETGEIQGRVMDEYGEGLPGVIITASSPSLQGTRTATSLSQGFFQFPLLPVGEYKLAFKLEGFAPLTQERVVVRLGHITDLSVKMALTVLNQDIVVTAKSPLIDITSTDTSYHLTKKELELIPVQGRSLVDVIKYTPGVTGVRMNTRKGTASEGQPSFRGEGEEGNNWVVDGISVSGVRLKNSGVRLNFDSIEEVQIISDPFSPELGSAFGGIINMVTKSGSNELSGEFSLAFRNKNLQSAREEQLAVVSEPDYFSDANWYFNLGGPIIKDKLWFFLSDNLINTREETSDSTVDYLPIPGGQKSMGVNFAFGKLTYALNSNHSLSLTTIFNTVLAQKGGTGIPDLYENKDFSDVIFQLNYKGIVNATTFIESGLGQVRRDSYIKPYDGNLGPAQYYIEDLARGVNNSYGNVTDNQRRLDFNVRLTKHIETETFGRHEVNIGFEYYEFSSEFAVDFTGKDEDIFPNDGFDNGTKYYFDTMRDGGGTPTVFYEYDEFSFVNSAYGIGFHFKDKATFGRFTFMAGFRIQTQTCLDQKKNILWSWGLRDFLSPRFSLSVDVTGDGVNVLKFGWGRFSDAITTMPLGLFNSGAGLKFQTYRWQGGQDPSPGELHDPGNWIFESEQGSQAFEIADGLEPNFLNRLLVQYDRRLGLDWAFTVRYVNTKAVDLLEVLAVFDPVTQYKFLYDNFEHKRRNYWGVEFELRGNLTSNIFVSVSYSRASAKGTNPGQTETGSWSQEEGSTNFIGLFGNHLYVPDVPELQEIKAWVDRALGGLGGRGIGDEGWYGNLPYSVDHNLKFYTIVFGPYGISFSAAFEYISGYYWEKLGYVPYFGGYYSYPEGRGTDKTPGHTYLDFGLEKTFHLGGMRLPGSMALVVRADVFNVFNSQNPISFVKEDIPIYGQVWGRQQPRQARLTVKFKF